MQQQTFLNLKKALSHGRLEAYRTPGGSDADTVAYYLWNAALCEALFPLLQQLEVSFRNALHDSLGNVINEAEWLIKLAAILQPREQERIAQAKQDLVEQQKPLTEDRVIGELNFGFWTSLADSRYDRLWPKFIKQAFPHMPNYLRNRPEIAARANKLRKLRNAVFHHHSIWHWSDLTQHHRAGLELIGWIEPDLGKLVELIDRFPKIYSEGPKVFNKSVSR